LVAAAKFLVAATKNLLVPNFVAVPKPFFFRDRITKESWEVGSRLEGKALDLNPRGPTSNGACQ